MNREAISGFQVPKSNETPQIYVGCLKEMEDNSTQTLRSLRVKFWQLEPGNQFLLHKPIVCLFWSAISPPRDPRLSWECMLNLGLFRILGFPIYIPILTPPNKLRNAKINPNKTFWTLDIPHLYMDYWPFTNLDAPPSYPNTRQFASTSTR